MTTLTLEFESWLSHEKLLAAAIRLGPTVAVIQVFIMWRPIIKKWGDYSTFKIHMVALKDIHQL